MKNKELFLKGGVLFFLIVLVVLGIFSGEDTSQIISSTIFVLIVLVLFFGLFELKSDKKIEKIEKKKTKKSFTKTFFKKFGITKQEIINILISILIMAFFYSYNNWPTLEKGLVNYAVSIFYVLFSFAIYETGIKLFSKKLDCKATYHLRPNMIFFSFVITIISGGKFPFFLTGYHIIEGKENERLGYKFEALRRKDKASIAFKSISLSLLFAILLSFFSSNALIQKIMIFNILFSLYNLIPWPPTDGSLMLYRMGGAWVFLFFGSIGLLLTLKEKNLLFSLIVSLLFVIISYVMLKKTEEWIGRKRS